MSSNLMDTEPGGEQTQYESIKTVTKAHASSEGQLGNIDNSTDEAKAQSEAEKRERGEKTAENMRYGQAISEQGVGGYTTTSSGTAVQRDAGSELKDADQDAAQSRREQGYGSGSGVGA